MLRKQVVHFYLTMKPGFCSDFKTLLGDGSP